jgi:hypothetical protein
MRDAPARVTRHLAWSLQTKFIWIRRPTEAEQKIILLSIKIFDNFRRKKLTFFFLKNQCEYQFFCKNSQSFDQKRQILGENIKFYMDTQPTAIDDQRSRQTMPRRRDDRLTDNRL